MSTIPFLAIPTAALAVARDETERLFVLALWEHADRIQGPFPASSRWLQDLGSMGAGKVSRLMSRLEAVAVVSTVTPGTRTGDPSIIACWRPKKRNTSRNTSAPIADTPRGTPQTPTGSGSQTDHRNTSRNTSGAERGTPRGTKNTELTTERSPERGSSVEQSSTMSNEQKAWDILESVRAELHQAIIGKGATGRAMLPKRKTAMARVLKTCRQVLAYHEERGADRVTVSAALELTARWMYLSANIRASGARSTGEPLTTMVNTSFHEYLELALQGADMPKPAPEDVEPTKAEQDADEAERVEAWEALRAMFEAGLPYATDPGPLESFGRDNVIRLERG